MPDETLRFSVVVPTRNRPEQLETCLQALAAQDYPSDRFEVIVVDDGGDRPIEATVSRFEDHLDVAVIGQSNQGPGAARNTGATKARGTNLAFTDDDCVPEPTWLAALDSILSKSADAVLVGGKVVNGLPTSCCSQASQLIVDLVYDHHNPDSRNANFFATNNMAVPTHEFLELGGFDPSFRTSEDRDLCDRWHHAGRRLVFAPEARIAHQHRLDLSSFVGQHFGYGRGAYRFNLSHQNRHDGASSIDSSFYLNLIREVPARLAGSVPWRLALVSLLVVWQASNTAGYVWEILTRRWRRLTSAGGIGD